MSKRSASSQKGRPLPQWGHTMRWRSRTATSWWSTLALPASTLTSVTLPSAAVTSTA